MSNFPENFFLLACYPNFVVNRSGELGVTLNDLRRFLATSEGSPHSNFE